MSFLKLITIALIVLVSTACSTTKVEMGYAPTTEVQGRSLGTVQVGSFSDERGVPSNWLGAIRGGYGNPLKYLELATPVNKLVESSMSDALRSRGFDVQSSNTKRLMTGSIKQLGCNQIVEREVNVAIDILVIDFESKATIFSRSYSTSKIDSAKSASGIFGSVEKLRAFTEKAFREVIDKAMDDSELRLALSS